MIIVNGTSVSAAMLKDIDQYKTTCNTFGRNAQP